MRSAAPSAQSSGSAWGSSRQPVRNCIPLAAVSPCVILGDCSSPDVVVIYFGFPDFHSEFIADFYFIAAFLSRDFCRALGHHV